MDFANLHDLKKVRKSDNIQGICEQTEHVPRGPLFVARAAEISHFFNLARLRDSAKYLALLLQDLRDSLFIGNLAPLYNYFA